MYIQPAFCQITNSSQTPITSCSSTSPHLYKICTKIMKIHSPRIPLLLILIMLTVGTISSSRDAVSTFQSKSSWYSSVQAPKESRTEEDESIYRASNRETPGGPNPLHNWLVSWFLHNRETSQSQSQDRRNICKFYRHKEFL